jgi:acyl-CoA hydrolase
VTDGLPASSLRPGDLVVVAQGSGEPTALLERLVEQRHLLPEGVEVFVGLSHSSVLADDRSRELRLVSFGAMGPLATHAAHGSLAVIPCNFADVPRVLRARAAGRRLVLCVQVGTAAADGGHTLGTAVDYTYELLDHADAVIAEVNDQIPRTTAPKIAAARLTATLQTSRPVRTLTDGEPTDTQHLIAGHVAGLVPDGATIQLGVGAVPSVVGSALQTKRGLRVRSTLVGNWLAGLADAGALAGEPGSACISEAAGSDDLYRLLSGDLVHIRPVSEVTRADELASIGCLIAMNSALEVDLSGQVNAEMVGRRFVAGIGGQADFMRAAQRSALGCSVVMLQAATGGGHPRIVPHLSGGTVSTPRASVDVVVTEYGVADLRGRDLEERRAAMIAIAHPEHRETLRRA